MARGKRTFKVHYATADDARKILAHVQSVEGDANLVEMPAARLFSLFDISYPLNLFRGDDRNRTLTNGFSKLTQPPVVNFNLKILAEVADVSVEAAKEMISANGMGFQKRTACTLSYAAIETETPTSTLITR